MCGYDNGNDDRRKRAYLGGAAVTIERLARERPQDARALAKVEAADVVVVRGSYDHVETVLEALSLPCTVITPEQLEAVHLRPQQLLVINCPGQVGSTALRRIRSFVEGGGTLFTTDWALKHVIEPAFPGLLEYNGRSTADDVVRIEVRNPENRFLRGVIDERDDPIWWLEGSSYPIRVLDPENVEVLITSKELEQKYGEAAVAVTFKCGKGEVLHLISHYYLQRSEARTARHAKKAEAFAAEKGVAISADLKQKLADVRLDEVEAAYTSTRLFANVVAEKKRRAEERRERDASS